MIGMSRSASMLLALCLGVAGGLACTPAPDPSAPVPPAAVPWQTPESVASSDTVSTADLVSGVDAFGFDLLRETAGSAGPNTVVSPYSVASALALTAHGSGGMTRTEILEGLHLGGLEQEGVDRQWWALREALSQRSPQQTLEIANAVWMSDRIAANQQFVDGAGGLFGAEVIEADFGRRDMAALVNAWVSDRTHGMIPELVQSVDREAVLLLANAVYFKGLWTEPFDASQTLDGEFTLLDGSQAMVPMMVRWSAQLLRTDTVTVVRMPYLGDDSAMYLCLPVARSGYANVLADMTGAEFLSAVRQLRPLDAQDNTILVVPRLDLAWTGENLIPALGRMGIRDVFVPGAADLRGMADVQPLWVSQLAHQARIKVGELGTEASAATYAAVSTGRPTVVAFDRPFLFAIVDESSDAILFLGAVTDPRSN